MWDVVVWELKNKFKNKPKDFLLGIIVRVNIPYAILHGTWQMAMPVASAVFCYNLYHGLVFRQKSLWSFRNKRKLVISFLKKNIFQNNKLQVRDIIVVSGVIFNNLRQKKNNWIRHYFLFVYHFPLFYYISHEIFGNIGE